MTTRIATVSASAALLLSLAGCGGATKHSTAAGAADPSVKGTVTVYTSLPQAQATAYLKTFKQQYPNVELKLVRDTPTAIVDKVVKEKKAPVADVIWHTPLSSVMRAVEASAIAPYAYHPGQIDALGGDFVDHDNPSNPFWVGTDSRLIAFAVKSGGDSPASFSDLLDPKYNGQIVMPSIKTEAGYNLVASLMSSKDEKSALDYLAQLDKNVAYYTDDESAPVKAVEDGSASVALGWDPSVVNAQNGGSAVDAVFPAIPELSPWDIDADALVKKAGSSPAAKVFLDWAISDPAMGAYAKDTPVTSVDIGAGLPSGYPATASEQLMLPADWAFMADNRARITAEWMKLYGKKIKAN